MTGESLQAKSISPAQLPAELGNAAVKWARCTRQGRMLVFMVLFLVVILVSMRHHEAISSRYLALSKNHQWHPSTHISFLPSNTTLQLENGEIDHVPTALKKTTPNFHLLMLPSEGESSNFCETTLSAMLLDYPPPTVLGLHRTYDGSTQRDSATLTLIYDYLINDKLVHDEDLVLIVDGQNARFQLPSVVMMKQYESVLEDANTRLWKRYGKGRFNQTIVFGAVKRCEEEDAACHYAPSSSLPFGLYGKDADGRVKDMPAKYLSSQTIMGPAKDLKLMYKAAVVKMERKSSQYQTIQSVFATLFGEQQLQRDAIHNDRGSRLRGFLSAKATWAGEQQNTAQQHEYAMGLDYTHTLFQPLTYRTRDELVFLTHNNSTDLSQYHHSTTLTPHLSLPSALIQAKAPFWRPDPHLPNPSPNDEPAYIDKLDFNLDMDTLPDRNMPWTDVALLQNTFTGAIPAIILNDNNNNNDDGDAAAGHVKLNNMWYSGYKRALLRNHLRAPQSAKGYHDSLVGGDRAWDTRGGRGGVWTAKEQIWLPWGEVDGVCGTVAQQADVFHDNKGVWLHEQEEGNEEERVQQEQGWRDEIERKRRKDGELEGGNKREKRWIA